MKRRILVDAMISIRAFKFFWKERASFTSVSSSSSSFTISFHQNFHWERDKVANVEETTEFQLSNRFGFVFCYTKKGTFDRKHLIENIWSKSSWSISLTNVWPNWPPTMDGKAENCQVGDKKSFFFIECCSECWITNNGMTRLL